MGKHSEREAVCQNISTHIDNNLDVVINDYQGNETNMYLVNCAATMTMKCRPAGAADASALPIDLQPGYWHKMPISKVIAAGTDKGKKIIFRLI
jgi:hypothetical protein